MLNGLDDLRRDLLGLARSLEREAGPAALKEALDVLESGVRSRTPRRTGALVSAEAETAPRDRRGVVSGAVVVASDHAAAVEFGTGDTPAEPYMRPTAESDGPRALDAAARSLSRWLEGID